MSRIIVHISNYVSFLGKGLHAHFLILILFFLAQKGMLGSLQPLKLSKIFNLQILQNFTTIFLLFSACMPMGKNIPGYNVSIICALFNLDPMKIPNYCLTMKLLSDLL